MAQKTLKQKLRAFSHSLWAAQQRYHGTEKSKEATRRYRSKPEIKQKIAEYQKAWHKALMEDPIRKAEYYQRLAARRKTPEYREKHRQYMTEYRQKKSPNKKLAGPITSAQIAANPYLALKQARLNKGIKVVDLASKVGVTRAYVYMIEAGDANPSPQILSRLVAVLGVTNPLSFFTGGSD